jgi:hypothetical protein
VQDSTLPSDRYPSELLVSDCRRLCQASEEKREGTNFFCLSIEDVYQVAILRIVTSRCRVS